MMCAFNKSTAATVGESLAIDHVSFAHVHNLANIHLLIYNAWSKKTFE